MPTFMKIYQFVQNLLMRREGQTWHADNISPSFPLESGLKKKKNSKTYLQQSVSFRM